MYLVRCVYTYKCVYGLLDFCLFVVLRIFSGKSFNIFVLFVAFGHSKYIKCIQHKVFSARFSDTFCEHTNYLCISFLLDFETVGKVDEQIQMFDVNILCIEVEIKMILIDSLFMCSFYYSSLFSFLQNSQMK